MRPVAALPKIAKVKLGPGCACAPGGAGSLSLKAVRKGLVVQMDGLNQDLRSLMKQIDQAVPNEQKDRITQPAPLLAALRKIACGLDCLLYRFRGATDALWSYLDMAARVGDMAQRTVRRLAADPSNRPTTPSITGLTRLFNRAARTSNESIGLALVNRHTPAVLVEVDASSFKSKVRRWREKLRPTLSDFERSWLPLVGRTKPRGPALDQPLRLRVALARLGQKLGSLARGANAIACKRGAGCAKPQAAWVAVGRSLGALEAHLKHLAKKLRAAGPTLSISAGRRLSESTRLVFAALRKAVLGL
jgi:hypothetical protein